MFLGGAGVAVVMFLIAGCGKNDAINQAEKKDAINGIPVPSLAETKDIAEQGFIYGLPIVMNYAVMYEFCVDKNSGQYKGPFNQIFNEHRVFTYKDTAIVTPNSDTPYSMLWVDLRAEPIVLSVPAVSKDRYYSAQLIDGNTYNYGYVGSRATGNRAGQLPDRGPRLERRNASRNKAGLPLDDILRPYAFSHTTLQRERHAERRESAGRLQSADTLRLFAPTSAAAAPAIDFPKADAELVKNNFFEFLDFALQFNPATPDEADIRAKLASIGIGPGKKFEMKDLSPEHKAAILLGMKSGDSKIEQYLVTGQKNINGWKISSLFGDRTFYNGDWLKRAAAAKGGIYGNDAVEAMYPMTRTTAKGETLDASKHNYTLTFPSGQFPPVNAFWSVTMYDGKTQLLIENPINRYLINSPMLPE